MITLIYGLITVSQVESIVGIILSVGEALIVILSLMSFFIDPKSSIGLKLNKVLKGLFRAKKTLSDQVEEMKKEKEENNDDDNTKSD